MAIPQNVSLAEEFWEKVVSFYRQDAVGNICRSDHAVLLLGDRLSLCIGRMQLVIFADLIMQSCF